MVRKLHLIVVLLTGIFLMMPAWFTAGPNDSLNTGEPEFHQVEALRGDGIFSLLRRYKLDEPRCNLEKFLELNKMQMSDPLIAGKTYIIPVLIYNYNGTSIRSTIGDDDMEKALRIQAFNEYLLAQQLRASSYRDSKILWVPYHELNGSKENPEPVTEAKEGGLMRFEPLFGANYASFPVEDESLKGKVFYVVPGHGGPDPGAQCTSCDPVLCEDEYAYDVCLRLARNLMQHGATVHVMIHDPDDGIRDEKYLACDSDERSYNKLTIPVNQKRRLQQRTDDINQLFAHYKSKGISSQTVISIHVDSRSQSKRQDVFFYHLKGSKLGEKIATSLHQTFEKKYDVHQRGRGYKGYVQDRGLYILRNTHPVAVFVELANIRNEYDHRRILLDSNRQALANWLFEGLVNSVP